MKETEGKGRESVFSASHLYVQSVSTADDPGPGLLLRVKIDGGNYGVGDFIGTRYGFAPRLKEALQGWAEQVEDILGLEGPLGDPIKGEVARYRKALGHG